jgi:hypothetical protein
LTATATLAAGVKTATTAPAFAITTAAATNLVFTTQPPTATTAGAIFATNPVVTIEDAYGNTVTTGSDSTTNVTLALTTGLGLLSGTTNVTAVGGVAAFPGLSINLEGNNKVLTATAKLTVGVKTATTAPAFTILPAAVPTLVTTPATNVMANTAYLGGNITATNGYPVTERGIYWGTNSGTVLADGVKYSESGTFNVGVFSFFVTNLPAGRTNYFLAYAVNSQGTTNAAQNSFLTRPAAPVILPPTNVTANALYANWQASASSTNYWLDVAATNDFTAYLAGYSNRVAGAGLTCAVTGLQTRVVYYYQVRAENATGVSTNSGVMTVTDGVIGLLPASLSYTGVYGGANPAAQSFVLTNSGYFGFNFTNSAAYSAGPAGWWLATPVTGAVAGTAYQAMTGGVDITGLNAGTYYATNAVISSEATNSPQYLAVTLTVGKASQAIVNFTPTNGSVFVLTNTAGLSATGGGSSNPVTFAVISGPGVIAGLTNLTFTNSGTVRVTANQSGDTNWNAAPTVTNTFNVSPPPTPNGWLAIQVTPASGTWQLTVPAGYIGPTAGTGSLAAVSAVTGAYGIAWGSMTGYVAPSNQSQFVTGGSTSLFTGVYLLISTNIAAPTGVSATEGTYTNRILVTWQGVAGAIDYEIWRSQTNNVNTAGKIADIPAGNPLLLKSSNTYAYDDYAVNPVSPYYYWIRAKTATLASPMSYVAMGYAALSPDQITGTADIAVSDMVCLPVNVTNLSCAGTVSFRVANVGPDALNDSGVAFDFYMGSNAATMVWIGSSRTNMTLNAGEESLVILTPEARRALTVRADLRGIQQVQVTVRHLSALNDPNLANNTTTAAGSVRIKAGGVNSPGRARSDYDGDGKSDLCLYQGTLGRWNLKLSGDRYISSPTVGDVGPGLAPVSGDYDGDGLTDLGAYNSLDGKWLLRYTASDLVGEGWLGGPEFVPAQADFDGDSKTDPTVYRAADGCWLLASSSKGYAVSSAFLGGAGYQPVAADYDGDGLADPAVYFNRGAGLWSIALSSTGYQVMNGEFGGRGLPAVADYDGDGLADPAVYNPSTGEWQVLLSGSMATQGSYTFWSGVFGSVNGVPVPADYDGDGKADFAVYHQDTGVWELFLSTRGYLGQSSVFGGPAYVPAVE